MPRLCFQPKEYAKPIDFAYLDVLRPLCDLGDIGPLHLEYIVANCIAVNWLDISVNANLQFLSANIDNLEPGQTSMNPHVTMEFITLVKCEPYILNLTAEFAAANSFHHVGCAFTLESLLVKLYDADNFIFLNSYVEDFYFIGANADKRWDWDELYYKFTEEYIIVNSVNHFSYNVNITEEFARVNADKYWEYWNINPRRNSIRLYYSHIESNPQLSLECILAHPWWNWQRLSENPNLTVEFIALNAGKIDFEHLKNSRFYEYNRY